jgi:hypothetical protein
MPLNAEDRKTLTTKAALPGAKPPGATAIPETDAEIDAHIRSENVPSPSPKLNPWAHVAVGPAKVVALAKHYFPVSAAEFTDKEIASYALHYMSGTVADMVKMVGLHMKDRIDARAAGRPQRDDSKGLAVAASEAEARAAAAAAELESLEG